MVQKKHATTPAIALFFIVSLSGVLLFFHQGGMGAHVIHEWLGLGFIIIGMLHVMANWKPFKKYLQGAKGIAVGLLILIPTAVMVLFPSNGGEPPYRSVMQQVVKSPLSKVASLYELSPQSLEQKLKDNGYVISSLEDSVEAISQANQKNPMATLSLIVKK